MSRASDILRERAQQAETIIAAYGLMHPDELRAIADLLDATAAYIAWTEGAGHGESGHDSWLLMRNALATAERAITGYSNASK